jgi:hypothetical protein
MTLRPDRALCFISLFSTVCAIALGAAGPARADGIGLARGGATYCNTITLVCENARTYGLCPIAVTDVGELVTGTLTTPGPTYVRLIPMGNGYRYAGRGIWFDGKGAAGRLFFGQNRSVACAVEWH